MLGRLRGPGEGLSAQRKHKGAHFGLTDVSSTDCVREWGRRGGGQLSPEMQRDVLKRHALQQILLTLTGAIGETVVVVWERGGVEEKGRSGGEDINRLIIIRL